MEFRLSTVVLLTIMAVSTILALCITETEARPSRHTFMDNPGWKELRILGEDAVDECEASPEVRSMCHRCAKQTKSNMALVLCCFEPKQRGFCVNFLNFGLNRISES